MNQPDGTSRGVNSPIISNPDLEPQPVTIVCNDPEYPDQPCPICKGIGVIKYAVPADHPRFGKMFPCPNRPVLVDEVRQATLRRLSNLDAFDNKTFEAYETDLPYYNEKQQQALRLALEAARSFARHMEGGWLLLEGTYGTGKTHLAAAIGNERLKFGDNVMFVTTPDLLDHLRNTYSPRAEMSYDELFDKMRNATLLILDDLGVENPSEWAKEKLFQLLNHRYSHQMATVITTNADLDSLDPRIRSRLLDINVIRRIVIDAPDYRNMTPNENEQVLLSRVAMYEGMTFESFDIETNITPPEQENLLKAARVAEEFSHQPTNWLLFMGNFGSGKTHLAASIANYRRMLGDDVLFMPVPDLLDYLRTTFDPKTDMTYDKLFNQIRNAQLLVLDDLGTESAKPWAQEKLFQILDYRYVGRKPTVITTAKKFEEINQRLVSRLIDSRVCRNIALTIPAYAQRIKRRNT